MFGTVMLMLQKFFVLAIGLTFGYWLIITAAKQENWKKIVGAVFGWILIIYTFVVSGMICFQWMEYLRTGKLMPSCPMHHSMQGKFNYPKMQKPCPMLEKKAKEKYEDENCDED